MWGLSYYQVLLNLALKIWDLDHPPNKEAIAWFLLVLLKPLCVRRVQRYVCVNLLNPTCRQLQSPVCSAYRLTQHSAHFYGWCCKSGSALFELMLTWYYAHSPLNYHKLTFKHTKIANNPKNWDQLKSKKNKHETTFLQFEPAHKRSGATFLQLEPAHKRSGATFLQLEPTHKRKLQLFYNLNRLTREVV